MPCRSAPEARYTNQHCRPLHQYKRAKGDGERAKETAMYDLVSRMLDYDPTFRVTLKEALRHHYFLDCYDDKENAAPPPTQGWTLFSAVVRLKALT